MSASTCWPRKQEDKHKNTSLKVKPFPGVQKIAPDHIEKRAIEEELRAAQFALDVQLNDLRTEFLHREAKLRACHDEMIVGRRDRCDSPKSSFGYSRGEANGVSTYAEPSGCSRIFAIVMPPVTAVPASSQSSREPAAAVPR